jgi:DNA replication protein DnaC
VLAKRTLPLESWDTVAYVLNYRYNGNKVTILTTNYLDEENSRKRKLPDPDTLAGRIGVRIRSRLFEMCKTIVMDGNDYRMDIKTAKHHF